MSTQLTHLTPVTIKPTLSSKAAAPISFLETIDRVEINSTIVHHDVVYYVVDIFLLHHTSRIPTLNTPTATSQPDYQVLHRFSDFADLRYQAWSFAQRKHEDGYNCKYCNKYMHFILYSLAQPRLYVKLGAGVERRKKVLKNFCNAFVDMARSKTETHRDTIQDLVAETMKKQCVAGSYASFTDALNAILAAKEERWRYIDVKSAMTLVCACKASHRMLRKWLEDVVEDLSLGKETLPVPVQLPTSKFHISLHVALQLMSFTYATSVQLPHRHNLPSDLLTKQQNDEQCQRVLRGRQVEVVLAQCKGKGWGVLATNPIEQGEFVGEYTGELVSTREMRRRYRELYDPQALNYVLSLREHVAQGNTLDFNIVRTNVDASNVGNLTRFFNHSCSPSLDVAAVRVDSFIPRLVFFARK
ncbi:hypothetical protein PHMEG_0007485, partial [Phytophthora megakarya]